MKLINTIMTHDCWVVRSDNGEYSESFRKNGIVALHFDISELPEGVEVFKSNTETYKVFEKFNPTRKSAFRNWWGTFNMFCNKMKVGDYVLTTNGLGGYLIGEVTSEIYFQVDNKVPHTVRRNVLWDENVYLKNDFPFSLNSFNCNSTCFYLDKHEEDESNEVIPTTIESKVISDNVGVVYIMKSTTVNGFYKVGYADEDADKRCSALSADKKYGCWNLEVIGYIKSKNYKRLEKAFHNHFAPKRLCIENGCNQDTELFNSENFIQDFKDYTNLIKSQSYYEISEIYFNQ
jgi:predicted Mrr-cat superfamily restriction endonuclease